MQRAESQNSSRINNLWVSHTKIWAVAKAAAFFMIPGSEGYEKWAHEAAGEVCALFHGLQNRTKPRRRDATLREQTGSRGFVAWREHECAEPCVGIIICGDSERK